MKLRKYRFRILVRGFGTFGCGLTSQLSSLDIRCIARTGTDKKQKQ